MSFLYLDINTNCIIVILKTFPESLTGKIPQRSTDNPWMIPRTHFHCSKKDRLNPDGQLGLVDLRLGWTGRV